MKKFLFMIRAISFIRFGACQFNLYPPIDPTLLARAYNVTPGCIAALNQTLPDCDPTLFQMAVNFDNYYWEEDNLTEACGSNCSIEARNWDLDVSLACADEWISAYGKLIPADSISGRFVDGIDTVCLGSTTDDRWCLGASLNWTGSDIIQPDCTKNPTDPSCISNVTAPENMRLANLYTDDILCDNCFIQLLYARVTSSFLADSDQSDFLVEQLQDIGDVCNVTIPDITVRALPSYVAAPPPTSINFRGGSTISSSAPAATTTCSGQILTTGSNCQTLSQKYGISTGDLQKLTKSDTCAISGSTCFPAACTLKQVPTSATCDSLASSLTGNITTVQFLTWNRNIMGLCDNLTAGQMVCVSAPGVNGTYTLATPPLGTGADAGNQQRGGAGGRVTPCPTFTNSPTAAPGPTQTGIVPSCNAYSAASPGIGCVDFATKNCINTTQLFQFNPVLGSNGENCLTLFWANEYYCINTFAASTSIRSTAAPTKTIPPSTSSASGVTAPGPTQSGIVSNCSKYAICDVGCDGCYDFAILNNITPAQFYEWNTVLGIDGANCGTLLWAKEYYCVGVSG